MRHLCKVVVIILVMIAGGCATTHKEASTDIMDKVVDSDMLETAALQYYWNIDVPLQSDEFVQNVYLIDENLYLISNLNVMTAIDAATGVVKWHRQITSPARKLFRPTHYDNAAISKKIPGIASLISPETEPSQKQTDLVCINSPTRLFVLDRTTGEIYRKIAFKFTANTGGACANQYFYVGGTDGHFHAIQIDFALHAWEVGTEDLITSPLETFGGRVYCASQDSRVYAYSTMPTKNMAWKRKIGGPITAGIHADPRGLFVPCMDNRLYAYETATGIELWEPFICEGPLRSAVQVSQNTIFQYADGDKFYAIDLATGRERWSRPDGRKVVGYFDGNVYILDAGRRLLVLDEMLGKVKHRLPTTGLDMFLANVSSPAIYAARRDGHVFCIRHKGAGHLKPEDLKDIRTTAVN